MSKFSKKEKLDAVKRRLEKKESWEKIAHSIGADSKTVRTWIRNYEVLGESAFERNGNRHYSKQEKS